MRLAVFAHTRAVEATVTPWAESRARRPQHPPVRPEPPGRRGAHAGAYVSRTFPAALAREHRHEPYGSRIATAVAAWDVHAHRAIVANPTAGHLRLVARTQELLLGHTAALSAAAQAGTIDAFQYATRLDQPWTWPARHGVPAAGPGFSSPLTQHALTLPS